VTSVQEWTGRPDESEASAAASLRVRMDWVTSATSASGALPFFSAVVAMLVPMRLVRRMKSPGRPPELDQARLGSTAPVTA
jgi:hypothetical protein